jgi:predicted ATPase
MQATSPSDRSEAGELPGLLSPFIGRRVELAHVLRLLEDPAVRLVTIVGPGGVGKTALALELARQLQSHFADGVVYVPLAHLKNASDVLPALAASLDLRLVPGDELLQAVYQQLADRDTLLLLDNFEHLLDGALLLRDLLLAAPHLRLLVAQLIQRSTSIGGGCPAASECPTQPGMTVFTPFSEARQPASISPDPQASSASASPGRGQSAGIRSPPAEHYTSAETESALSRSSLTSFAVRDAEPRHASLRLVFQSSYERLSESQRSALRALSVFRGGFDAQAAQAIAGSGPDVLIQLTEKSLLARQPDSRRYELHELVRQYAAEALAASPDCERVLGAYSAYYANFVVGRRAAIKSPGQARALDEIQVELANISYAWAMIVEARDLGVAAEMLPALYAFCDMRSRFYEGDPLPARPLRVATSGEPRAWALACSPGMTRTRTSALRVLDDFAQWAAVCRLRRAG